MKKIKDQINDFVTVIAKKFIKDKSNVNKIDRARKAIYAFATFLIVLLPLAVYKESTSTKKSTQKHSEVVSVVDDEFSAENQTSALETQQHLIESQQKAIKALETKIDSYEATQKKLQGQYQEQNNQLLARLKQQKEELNKDLNKNEKKLSEDKAKNNHDNKKSSGKGKSGDNLAALGGGELSKSSQEQFRKVPQVKSFEFTYEDTEDTYVRNARNFIPTGTYCKAVLLSAADASAAVDGPSNTSPITMKIVGKCNLPNNKYSFKLKNSLVTASVYGDIGSERGIVRLDNLSYFNFLNEEKGDDSVIDIPVEGTVVDISGRNGIKGIPTLANDKILQTAGLSGLLAGAGDALQASTRAQSVTGSGIVDSYDPGQVGYTALGGGLGKASDKLSDYYIKLAERYAPVITLSAGSVVNVVFLKGFPVDSQAAIERYAQQLELARKSEESKEKTNAYMNSSKKEQAQDLANKTEMQEKIKSQVKAGVANSSQDSPSPLS